MTVTRGLILSITATVAAGLAGGPGLAADGANVRLKTISSRTSPVGASLVIEATDPMAYVATQPDPLTLVLDLRNVSSDGVTNRVPVSPSTLIAGVLLEETNAMGAPASRIRVLLTQAAPYRVRSERNTILVDFDKTSEPSVYAAASMTSREAPNAMRALAQPKQPALDAIRAIGVPQGVPERPAPAAAPANAVAQQQPPAAPDAPKRYTGALGNWNLEDADLRGTLRLIQDVSGLNMVLDNSISGRVNLVLTQVPWDQTLDVILKMNKLGAVVEDTIVRIAPLSVLADEEVQRRKLSDEQALSGELRIMTKTLSYAKAGDLSPLLKTQLSTRGQIQVDARTNTLIITDLPGRLDNVASLVVSLDRAQPQVEIEARIVRTTSTYARALGVQWGFNGSMAPAQGNTTNLVFPNTAILTGRAPGAAAGTAVNLPAQGATSGVGLAFGSVSGAFNLDATLTALETSGKVRLLSTPRVTTLNNVKARVAQGLQVPYQTTSNNTVTTEFKDASLYLEVTPQITEAGTVIMLIAVDKGSLGELTPGGVAINTQSANTTVLVSDGETTVIGGIFEGSESNSNAGTPGLSKVPFLRWLFKSEDTRERNDELLIFITPRIIRK